MQRPHEERIEIDVTLTAEKLHVVGLQEVNMKDGSAAMTNYDW